MVFSPLGVEGKFEKGLAELDRVMASFWAGLVRFGLQFGLGCVPNAAFWRAHKPNRKYKPTVQLAYKRPRKPNPNIRDRSDLDLVLPMMLSKGFARVYFGGCSRSSPQVVGGFDGGSSNGSDFGWDLCWV